MTKPTEEVKMTQRDTIASVFILNAVLNAKLFRTAVDEGVISYAQAAKLAAMTDSSARYWMETMFPNGSETVDEERLQAIMEGAKNAKNATLQCGSLRIEDDENEVTADVAGPQPTVDGPYDDIRAAIGATEVGVVDDANPDTWENPQTVEELVAYVEPYAQMMGRITALATYDGRLSFEAGLAFNRGLDRLFEQLARHMFADADGSEEG